MEPNIYEIVAHTSSLMETKDSIISDIVGLLSGLDQHFSHISQSLSSNGVILLGASGFW